MIDPRLAQLLSHRNAHEVGALLGFWDGTVPPSAPTHEKLRHLSDRMADAEVVASRLEGLVAEQRALLEQFLRAPGYQRSADDLAPGPEAHERLRSLELLGFVFEVRGPAGPAPGTLFVMPRELGDAITSLRERSTRRIHETITLRGFLARYIEDSGRDAAHAGEMYKLYADEDAILARVRKLPAPLQELVVRA